MAMKAEEVLAIAIAKIKSGGGGGGGTTNYNSLDNKPQINDVELVANKSLSDLGIASASEVAGLSSSVGQLSADLGLTKSRVTNLQELTTQLSNNKADISSLGTSAYKNSTSVVTDSSDLVESGAVKDIVGWGNKNKNSGDVNCVFVKSTARRFSFPIAIPIVNGHKYKFVADISNISGYTGADALGLRIAATGGNISSTYAIQTTAQGQIVIEMTATGNSDSANIYCFIPSTEPDNATITLSNVMVVEESVTDYSYEPYHASVEESLEQKADNSVIGTVEDGTNPTKSYAVGEHMVRGGKFCTVTSPVTTSSTWVEGSNYTSGDVASELDVVDITNEFTFIQDFTWDSGWTKIYKIGNKINGYMRFTAPSTLNTAVTLVSVPEKYRSSKLSNIFLGVLSETWSGIAKGCALLSTGIYCPDTSNLTSSNVIVAFEYLL